MKTVALYNLGCKVNAYELEAMAQRLRERGFRIVPFEGQADIYIVNTCTVTNIADRKSRQMLHRARQRNPGAVVVAAGCAVQNVPGGVGQELCIDLAVDNAGKREIAEILERYLAEHSDKASGGSAAPERDCAEPLRAEGRTRAYIKIQDGCNQFCAYCVIPYVRGRVRSRRPEEILEEVRGIAGAGYREVVLTGIHISSYGADFQDGSRDGGRLVELVERIHEMPGLERIRLGSLEPRIVDADAAGRLAALPKFCPHFHLSLQSGCDDTLRRMNRHYTTGEYYTCVETLRKFFDSPAITTDVIVGFPGETEGEFARTKAFLEKVGFYEIHVFKYSRREGTAAAAMPGQVPEPVKARRSGELLELTRAQAQAFRARYIGREAEVLLEERREIGGQLCLVGHTKDYVKIAVAEDGAAENDIVRAQVSGFLTEEILTAFAAFA